MQPVRVEAPAAEETDDLLEALSVRGLAARRVGPDQVEVEAEHEDAWNLEIVAALEAWLVESEHDVIVARQGEQTFTVKAPDRREPVRPAPPSEHDAAREGRAAGVVAITVAALVLVALAVWLLVSPLGG